MTAQDERTARRDLPITTHSRYPIAGRDDAYTRSYRGIRLVVGVLGILLPLVLISGEARFLRGGVHIRGSLSAYYHTPMQDIFVGGLCVIGFLLATYMIGEWKSWDFVASFVAGIAVLGVVYFPTSRAGLPAGAPACGPSTVTPPGCSFVEQELGEHRTAIVHACCAVVFILCLAVMSVLFAHSEVPRKGLRAAAGGVPGRFRHASLFWLHTGCALLILAALAWAFAGTALHADIWQLTPIYLGEVVAVWSFGVSWLVAGFYLTAPGRYDVPPSVVPRQTAPLEEPVAPIKA
jgi:hypothetical protein